MTRAIALASVVLASSTAYFSSASQNPPGFEEPNVTIEVKDGFRHISSKGLPNHAAGPFVYRNGAIDLREQSYSFRVTEKPVEARRPTPVTRGPFGVALNGVPFESRPEEYWENSRSGWTLNPLRNEQEMQIDRSNGHAEREGAYHYHGLPGALINSMGRTTEMRLIGWAADGFPIYDQMGYRVANDPKSGLKVLTPSYWVRAGNRPSGPGGSYDGAFVEDWEYIEGRGDLDECNGRTGVTPEFPNGTYYYVITERFPGVPRFFKGTPDASFTRRGRDREW